MDVKQAAKTLGMDEGEFMEILQLFIEVSQNDLSSLDEAIQSKDARRVFEISHSIKGSAVNLGFTDISEVARKMELNARQNNLDGIDEGYSVLKEKISLLQINSGK